MNRRGQGRGNLLDEKNDMEFMLICICSPCRTVTLTDSIMVSIGMNKSQIICISLEPFMIVLLCVSPLNCIARLGPLYMYLRKLI